MRKTFQVGGYGVNKLGLTLGIHYTITTTSESKAREMALWAADAGGYKHVRITSVKEASHE